MHRQLTVPLLLGAIIGAPSTRAQPQPADDAEAPPADRPAGAAQDQVSEGAAGPGGQPAAARPYGFFSGRYRTAEPLDWTIAAEPLVWYAAPGGLLEIGGQGLFDLDDLNIDSPSVSPMGEAHLRFAPWTITLAGSLVEVSGAYSAAEPQRFGAVSIAPGERARARITVDSAEVHAGYRLWDYASSTAPPGAPSRGPGFFGRFDLTAGLRFYDIGYSVERLTGPPGYADAGLEAVHPVVGFRTGFEFDGVVFVETDVNLGGLPDLGGTRSSSVSIQVALGYRPVESVAVQIGYRLRTSALEDDGDEYDGAVAGLFAGFVLRH